MAWGPSVLCVEAKSPARASGAASQLATLGFKPIASEDDAKAGILSLSKDPDAIQAKITSFDLSRRRWDERIEPLIWAGCAIVFLAPQVLAIAHVIRRGSLSHLAQGLLSSAAGGPYVGMADRDRSERDSRLACLSLDRDSLEPSSQLSQFPPTGVGIRSLSF